MTASYQHGHDQPVVAVLIPHVVSIRDTLPSNKQDKSRKQQRAMSSAFVFYVQIQVHNYILLCVQVVVVKSIFLPHGANHDGYPCVLFF